MPKKTLCALAALTALAAAANTPPPAETPITKLSVFKNGVVAVQREVKSDTARFTIPGNIVPSTGSLWFTPFDGVTVSNFYREEADESFAALYAGKKVVVDCLFGNEVRTCRGTVMPPEKKTLIFSHFNTVRSGGSYGNEETVTLQLDDHEFLTLNRRLIVAVSLAEPPPTGREEESGMVVSRPADDAGKPLAMRYLTRGVVWSPAYKIELLTGKKLRLSMSAVVVNELEEFADAEVELISGYPNLPFANTPDLLASHSSYGQATASVATMGFAPRAKSVAMNYAMADEAVMAESDEGSAPVSEDMQYRDIGKLSMQLGEKRYLPLDSAEAEYENVVEWRLNSCRYANGRAMNSNGGNPDLWDCLRFKNPFPSAITSGVAEVVSAGQVTGQNRINWLNAGEETLFKVTKALTVAGKLLEEEDVKDAGSLSGRGADVVYLYGNKYRKATVNGTFTIKNYRSSAAKVITVVPVNGNVTATEGDPKITHPTNELFGVNQPNLLTWELNIEPSEEVTIKYKYEVLVLL